MTKHTPGPWAVEENGDGRFAIMTIKKDIYHEHKFVCATHFIKDANLIAAAPDLLEAARATLNGLKNMSTEQFSNGEDRYFRLKLIDAIDKAEGRGK